MSQEDVKQKIDLLFQKMEEVRKEANKAHTLADFAAKGHVELQGELKALRITMKNILKEQQDVRLRSERFEKVLDSLEEKLDLNFRWIIKTLIIAIFSGASIIVGILSLVLR